MSATDQIQLLSDASLIAVEAQFDDCDGSGEATIGWDLDFCQLERGKLNAELTAVFGSNLTVQHVRFSHAIHQRGTAPVGTITLGLPDDMRFLNWFTRQHENDRQLLNFSRADGYDSMSAAGFSGLTFSVPSATFQRAVAALTGDVSATPDLVSATSFDIRASEARRLRVLAQGLVGVSKRPGANQSASSELEEDIIHTLARLTLKTVSAEVCTSFSSRQRAVDRALELIDLQPSILAISELHTAANVSSATLNRGFKERFGVSPKQYLVARRLCQARRCIQSSGDWQQISSVAYDFGFWHLGRFASDYRSMFGELPSETRLRAKKPGQ